MPDSEPSGGSSPHRLADFVRQLPKHRFWTSTKGILTALAAIATVVGVAIKFVPTSEACGSNTGTLSNTQIGSGTLEDFLERTSSGADPTAGYDPDKLDDPVRWASVAVSVEGHKGKYLTLKWSMVHAKSSESGDLPTNRRAVDFRPPGCEKTAFREEVLLPPIPAGQEVYVTFDLVDEANESLPPQEVRTAIIRGANR